MQTPAMSSIINLRDPLHFLPHLYARDQSLISTLCSCPTGPASHKQGVSALSQSMCIGLSTKEPHSLQAVAK